MTKTQAREGHQRFVELAQAIGDRTGLDRIGQGLHPFKNEPIDAEGWTGMGGVAA